MKTIQSKLLFLTVSFIFISCSNDNEILDTETVIKIPQDKDIPTESSPAIGAVKIPGSPKSLKKYQNGNLYYWAQYYYRSDGKLIKVNYGHPEAGPEIYSDTYQYNTKGKLMKLVGHDVYNFYWDRDRIIEAYKNNGMWNGRSKISYTYNQEGLLIQKTENNLDFSDHEKTIYSYFKDGNLKTIEQFGDYTQSGVFELYFITNFEGYTGDENLFLELEIIPGQIVQHLFPTSMRFKHLTESGYDKSETYNYKYDTEGRVTEKIFGSSKVVYQYY